MTSTCVRCKMLICIEDEDDVRLCEICRDEIEREINE